MVSGAARAAMGPNSEGTHVKRADNDLGNADTSAAATIPRPATARGVRRVVGIAVASTTGLAIATLSAAALTLTSTNATLPGPAPGAAESARASTPPASPGIQIPALPELAANTLTGNPITFPIPAYTTANTSGEGSQIPATALAAYQRAASIITAADSTCQLSWTLLAAVGEIVSNHGIVGRRGTVDDGIPIPLPTPSPAAAGDIVGRMLTDLNGTILPDTEAGRLDGDPRHDRPVGPLLIAPTIWAVVGVDGDADGSRDPQDIDDAALAAAVVLCSRSENLTDPTNRAGALAQLNANPIFIRLTLAVDVIYQRSDIPPATIPSIVAIGATRPAAEPSLATTAAVEWSRNGPPRHQQPLKTPPPPRATPTAPATTPAPSCPTPPTAEHSPTAGTSTPASTPTPSPTPAPTISSTASPTPAPSSTPSPAATPTPTDMCPGPSASVTASATALP